MQCVHAPFFVAIVESNFFSRDNLQNDLRRGVLVTSYSHPHPSYSILNQVSHFILSVDAIVFFFFCICPMTSNHHGPADWVMREDILVPRAVILLANATDRELWPGPIFWSLRIAAAKSENVWSELIIPIWFFCISSANQNKSFSRNLPELARACQSSRSVTLAKRIAAMGTRMGRRKS